MKMVNKQTLIHRVLEIGVQGFRNKGLDHKDRSYGLGGNWGCWEENPFCGQRPDTCCKMKMVNKQTLILRVLEIGVQDLGF